MKKSQCDLKVKETWSNK